MTTAIGLRDFQPGDADRINDLAVAAFEQFQNAYIDWPVFRSKLSAMSTLASTGELIVAESGGFKTLNRDDA